MRRPTAMRTSPWLSAAIALALPALALAEPKPKPATIRVIGEAVLQEAPDQAEIEVGVVTSAKTAPEAGAENARKVAAVIAAAKKAAGAKAEVGTASYSLTPNQEWPERGGTPKITGYTASNAVAVRSGDLAVVGPTIDAAMEAGANQIQSLRFSLRDEDAAKRRALARAAKQASEKAAALADALGVKTGRIVAVVEEASAAPPVFARAAMMEAKGSAPTPIEAGSVEVRANVSLEVEIAP